MKTGSLLLIPVLITGVLNAQHGVLCNAHRAFVLPHNSGMTEMMSGSTGLELGMYWRIDKDGRVDKRQHHPIAGISAHYFHLGKELNGQSVGMHAFYEGGRPLWKGASFRARLGAGAGYLTQQFNIYSNVKNRAIGSHLNGFMQILCYVQQPVTRKLELTAGAGLSHYSNGNWSMPNLGINLPGVQIGLRNRHNPEKFIPMKYERGRNIIWELGARIGKREMSIDDPRNISIYMLEFSGNYPHNNIRGWRGGMNVFFDRTYLFTKFQPLARTTLPGILEVAFTVGHEYRINRIGFVTDMGFYLYRPNDTKRRYYEAIGLKYYITNHFLAMSRLKAHLTSADYFEWGISYVFSGRESAPGFKNCLRWLFGGLKPVHGHNDVFSSL